MTVTSQAEALFDERGRRIPKGLLALVYDASHKFHLNQPKVRYANRLVRLHGNLGVDTGVTAEALKEETERLLGLIRENSLTANLANGVYLPVVCPKLSTDDLGRELENYLTAVGTSYQEAFSGRRTFHNHRKGTLDGRVEIAPGSRHEELVMRMKDGPVMGLYFPNSLRGFSIKASREQMAGLPEGFILSGLDAVIAMILYPDVLARNWKTPGIDLAALSWLSVGLSLRFKANNDFLNFLRTIDLGFAYDSFSAGLLFVGAA